MPGSASRDSEVADGRSRAGLIAMVAAIVSFSLSTPIVKWTGITGVVLAFWRMWMSVATWWIVLVGQRRSMPDRRAWKLVAPAGLLFGMNISLLFTAVTKTSIAHVEFIATMTPLLVVPAGAIFFREQPNWSALRYGLISILGVAMVLFFGPPTGTATLGGDVIMLLVLCSWTGYLLFTKRARAAGVDTVTFMACMMPLGLITTVPMAIVLAGDEIWTMTARGWLVAAVLAILTGMIAHGCIAFAQQHLPIATITVMQTSQPALAVFFAFLILGEEVRELQVVGMGLVIAGIAAFTLVSQRGPGIRSATPSTPAGSSSARS
jgi:drug/metabolite transporter (DMT)-like permease